MIRLLLLLLLTLLYTESSQGLIARRADDQEFEVVTNPHDHQRCQSSTDNNEKTAACSAFSQNLDHFLEPYYLITQPLPTQLDTFQKISHVKIMGVPVPTYHMKQPARLSEAELAFQIILVKDLSVEGRGRIQAVEVEMDKAQDSWFPGYYWSPLIVQEQDSGYQHVGWKFTALSSSSQDHDDAPLLGTAASLPHFYALTIETKDNREKEAVTRLSGFKAPGWMAQRILS